MQGLYFKKYSSASYKIQALFILNITCILVVQRWAEIHNQVCFVMPYKAAH